MSQIIICHFNFSLFFFFEIIDKVTIFVAENVINDIKFSKMTTMKKPYEKPSMKVFELKQQPQLLAGSDVSATMDGTFTEETI